MPVRTFFGFCILNWILKLQPRPGATRTMTLQRARTCEGRSWNESAKLKAKEKKKSISCTYSNIFFVRGSSSFKPVEVRYWFSKFYNTLGSGGYHFLGSDLIVLFDSHCKRCSCSGLFSWGRKSILTGWDLAIAAFISPNSALFWIKIICTQCKGQRAV